MDKYEFNIKVEQLKKLVKDEDYATAMEIADNIDWRRVHNANLLSTVSEIYERMRDYTEAKEILLLAYERLPVGKHLLYRLTKLAVKEGSLAEAEAYYNEFNEMAPNDSRALVLRYMIMKEKAAPVEQLISILESYNRLEINEKWMYELAEIYHIAGRSDDCVRICDNIMLMFGVGEYVNKAMLLKKEGEGRELSAYQQSLINKKVISKTADYENTQKQQDEYEAESTLFFRENTEAESIDKEYTESEKQEANDVTDEGDFWGNIEREEQTPDENHLEGNLHKDDIVEESAEKVGRERYRYAPLEADEEDIFESIQRNRAQKNDVEINLQKREDTSRLYKYTDEISYMRELEAEEKLKKEVSGIHKKQFAEEREEEKTKILSDLKEVISTEELKTEGDGAEEKETEISDKNTAPETLHKKEKRNIIEDIDIVDIDDLDTEEDFFIIVSGNPVAALEEAVSKLKLIHHKSGRKNQVIKIKASKLNKKGIRKSADKIRGKDLVIEEAGDLDSQTAEELYELVEGGEEDRSIILIDNPLQIEKLAKEYPDLTDKFGYRIDSTPSGETEVDFFDEIEEDTQDEIFQKTEQDDFTDSVKEEEQHMAEEEMDIDSFGEYAGEYAGSIDCVIDGKSMLALLERAEIMQSEGIKLTKDNARELIEEAADKAEKPGFVKRIFGFLSPKYNKEGMLILKEEHFI